ncbi:class I SAM-dependent methyltransferase [Haloarchaeobius sp. HRN-SO-5]|uniref:class I SAM-dependent methyltransferase n=1 Tax=Haloarchaeobius sp. HRN-SO-5 TaxID=3446118 RepID=UPI003EB7D070
MQADDSEAAEALDQRNLVRRSYDELADVYAAETGPNENDVLVDRLQADAPDGPLLDAGCGDGETVLEYLADDRTVTGLDFSREQATRANRVVPGMVAQGDMTALPFAADSFAAVTAFYSIIHVPGEQHADVYEEFARVLRPAGVVLVTTGTEDWVGRSDDWLDGGAPMEWDILGPEKSTDLLNAAGFEVYETVGVVDAVGDDVDREKSRLVDPDSGEAEKLFLFARLTD